MSGGSNPQLLAQMAAFWVEYDAAESELEKRRLYRDFLLSHGGRYPDSRDGSVARVAGLVIGGLHPVRPPG